MTARESLRVAILAATERLEAAGVASPAADAEALAAYLLRTSRAKLGLTPLVDTDQADIYRHLVDQRASRIPLQHLVGSVAIGSIEIQVGPGVFIPRPETDLMVDAVLAMIAPMADPVVVDLCAGSGAIALAVAAARPDATVHAVEKSPTALAWARRNAELRVAAGDRPIDLRGGDFRDERLLLDLEGSCDVVISNPPYVPDGTAVEPEVANYDPPEAVFAGADGLELIRPLITVAAGLLRPGGLLAIEHDASHGESVPALLRARRVLADVEAHDDLAGRPRFVTARRVRMATAVDRT